MEQDEHLQTCSQITDHKGDGHYTEKVLNKIDFLKEFTSITEEEMDGARKMIRPNQFEPIIRKDKGREPILYALVKILETHEDLPAKELKAWVEAIRIQ